jgi:hypothetical protein
MNELAEYSAAIRTPEQLQENINIIQNTMKRVMKNGIHFGTIPGTGKPSLFKPGAEIIMSVFRFVPTYEVIDLSTEGFIRYRIITTIATQGGEIVGTGVGECSTAEEKFCWRKAVCDEEMAETPTSHKRKVWKKGKGGGSYSIDQIKTNPHDMANTCLKMGKKRSLIDALLTATAASDLFSQDTEDLPKEYVSQYESPPAQSYKQTVKPAKQDVTPEESTPHDDAPPPEEEYHQEPEPKPEPKKRGPKPKPKSNEEKAETYRKQLVKMLKDYFFGDDAAMEECCMAMTDYKGKGLRLDELEGASAGRLYHAVQNMEKFLEQAADDDLPFNEE